MFETIVHPTDLSEESIPALQTAHDLAKQLGSKLVVCFIAHPPLVATGDRLTDPSRNETRNIAEELESHQPSDAAVQREVRIVITEKHTRVKTLLSFLEESGTDLLVIGMHKRGGVAGWLGSTITEEVVRRAGCAVMVVKHHDVGYDLDEESEDAAESDQPGHD
jgi:nucleotide-binding universal stress UspA family protein